MKLFLCVIILSIRFFAFAANDKIVSIKNGQKVFLNNCTACHGTNGDGNGPAAAAISGVKPRDFTTGVFKYGRSEAEVFNTITKGVPGTAMPPWNFLSISDRKSVIKYILTLKK